MTQLLSAFPVNAERRFGHAHARYLFGPQGSCNITIATFDRARRTTFADIDAPNILIAVVYLRLRRVANDPLMLAGIARRD